MPAARILCAGDHSTGGPVQLGTVDLPAGTPPGQVTAATRGYLCVDCGAAYTFDVATRRQPAGHIPTRARVDQVLIALGLTRTTP